MPIAETYMSRRRNILPKIYLETRKYTRKRQVNRVQHSNVVIEIEQAQQNVFENGNVVMNEVDQDQRVEAHQRNDENGDVQMNEYVEIQPAESRQDDVAIELGIAREIIAKRDGQINLYEKTIQNLHSLLGEVDLTEDELNDYDEILMSNEETKIVGQEIVSVEESEEDSDCESDENKENQQQNVHIDRAPDTITKNQKDMMFSFSHEFTVDVITNINIHCSVFKNMFQINSHSLSFSGKRLTNF